MILALSTCVCKCVCKRGKVVHLIIRYWGKNPYDGICRMSWGFVQFRVNINYSQISFISIYFTLKIELEEFGLDSNIFIVKNEDHS